MKAPPIKHLCEAFPRLGLAEAALIRELAAKVDDKEGLGALLESECEETHAWRRRCHHDPMDQRFSRRELVMHAVDRLLDAHGVEALGPAEDRAPYAPMFSYCNMGDPYAATLVYDRNGDNLFIGSWGDLVEKYDLV